MHDASTKRFDSRQRAGKVSNLEVRKRKGVSGTGAARVDAERRSSRVRLPALSFSVSPSLELDTEKLAPEATSALGVVSRELDQGELRMAHRGTR